MMTTNNSKNNALNIKYDILSRNGNKLPIKLTFVMQWNCFFELANAVIQDLIGH